MSSFGESSAFKHSEQAAADYVEYNKTHLARTYPSGVRVDSSNYEPVDLWNSGCQIGERERECVSELLTRCLYRVTTSLPYCANMVSHCVIVALNYQTTGKPMDMVMGKFQQNGNSGYILKPEIMREGN